MNANRWNFEDAARREWSIVVGCAVTMFAGLALFAALFLN